MKKIFLTFMFLAGLATCFTGCKKNDDEPKPPIPPQIYSNTFTIGDETYDINVSKLIENLSFGDFNLNIIVFASKDLQEEHNNVICVIYYNGIELGIIDIAPTNYIIDSFPLPKVIALKDCNITETLQNINNLTMFPDIYTGLSGSLTLKKSGETYTIITDNMMLKHNNDEITGAIDFQGTLTTIPFPIVSSGSFSLNEKTYTIFQAGTIHHNFMGTDFHLMMFLPIEMNKVIAIVIGEEIPIGTFNVPLTPLLFINNFNIFTMQGDPPIFAIGGTIVIEKQESDIYHITITDGKFPDITLNLEYAGKIPEFNFN